MTGLHRSGDVPYFPPAHAASGRYRHKISYQPLPFGQRHLQVERTVDQNINEVFFLASDETRCPSSVLCDGAYFEHRVHSAHRPFFVPLLRFIKHIACHNEYAEKSRHSVASLCKTNEQMGEFTQGPMDFQHRLKVSFIQRVSTASF
jgi:hypothetical protein